MNAGDRDSQTICAVSTPHGVGGISVLRISGPESLLITRQIAAFLPLKVESHRVYFGTLKDADTQEEIDEVLVTYFQKGHSFTDEEVLEISCHGNPHICQKILNQLIGHGARAADRGEFTYRAFMNGRVDLVQAESVLSLIESQSDKGMKLSLRQLKGQLSKKLEAIEDSLTWLMAHLEAGIDFSTEGLEIVSDQAVISKLSEIEFGLQKLVDSYRAGRILRDGVRVAFAGRPNVGKSSLLNLLLEEDRAIVTEVAGTTRDVISGDTQYAGIKFTFLDTAGIRNHASDLVEQIGIRKSHEAHTEADVVIFVYDLAEGLIHDDFEVLRALPKQHLYVVGNKLDKLGALPNMGVLQQQLASVVGLENLTQSEEFAKRNLFFISALDQNARPLILNEIATHFSQTDVQETVLLSNARHFENLSKALANTVRSQQLLKDNLGAEFLAVELKEALIAVQETLGKRFDDQVMDRVFKEFCLGK
jgi:tRNA modification GTPase